jgi:hypothetical protein
VAGISSAAAASESAVQTELTPEELAVKAARSRVRIPTSPLDKITMRHFVERTGTTFAVRAESGTVKLTCVSAEDHNVRKVRGLDAFVVIFRGPGESPLTEGIYAFSHGSLDDFDLHIAPHGADAQGLLYQAVFCRFTPQEEER